MFDTRKTLHDRGILDVIKILSSNCESGKLQMSAGKLEGAFYFKGGQLVDARVGQLTGFQAVNAVASMRNAHFDFDPSVNPPHVSSITPSERIVLKQFFGIETVDSNAAPATPAYSDDDEVTLETNKIPVEVLQDPALDTTGTKSLYRSGGLILGVLFLLIAVAAVALRNQYRERALPQSVASTQQPAAHSVAEEVKADHPSASVDQPKVARDLTGKWNVVNSVQKTSYRSFQNLKVGFEIFESVRVGRVLPEQGRRFRRTAATYLPTAELRFR